MSRYRGLSWQLLPQGEWEMELQQEPADTADMSPAVLVLLVPVVSTGCLSLELQYTINVGQ